MKGFLKWTFVVIILVVAITVAIHFAEDEIDKNTQEDIKTEMLQVQAKAKIVLERYHVNNENLLKGEKMEDASLEEAFGITDIANFYKWTEEILKEEGIGEPVVDEGEYYLVNYDTEEVIYSAGIKSEDGNVYYKLSEIKKLNVQENQEPEEVQKIEETLEEGEVENDGEREPQTE